MEEIKKRNTAYKLRIGDILKSKPIKDQDKLICVELGDKKINRVNLIANAIEKYIQDGEKKYASVTLDDASGQIRLKAFADDISILQKVSQGDTLQIIGTVREYNDELYILPEVVKSVDPKWLLVRKLEIQNSKKDLPQTNNSARDQILNKIKQAEEDNGIDTDQLLMDIEASPDIINQEIKKLLEEGLVYEPKPGRLRYLG